jgi:hypothetical protein
VYRKSILSWPTDMFVMNLRTEDMILRIVQEGLSDCPRWPSYFTKQVESMTQKTRKNVRGDIIIAWNNGQDRNGDYRAGE